MTNVTKSQAAATAASKSANWRLIARDSFANIYDLAGDWIYFIAIYNRDFGVEEGEEGEDGEDGVGPLNVGVDICIYAVFVLCILSTLFFIMMVINSFRKKSYCKCTINRLSLLEVILEDIPQLILTAYIDLHFSGALSPKGVLNISSSMFALVMRLTTHYEEEVEQMEEAPASNYKEML